MQMKVIRVYSTIKISSDRGYSFRVNSLILYGRISEKLTTAAKLKYKTPQIYICYLEKLRILYWPTRLIQSKAIEIKELQPFTSKSSLRCQHYYHNGPASFDQQVSVLRNLPGTHWQL